MFIFDADFQRFFVALLPWSAAFGLLLNWGPLVRSFRTDGPAPEGALYAILIWSVAGPVGAYMWVMGLPQRPLQPAGCAVSVAVLILTLVVLYRWARWESRGVPAGAVVDGWMQRAPYAARVRTASLVLLGLGWVVMRYMAVIV